MPDRIEPQIIESYKETRLKRKEEKQQKATEEAKKTGKEPPKLKGPIRRAVNMELLCLQAMLKWGYEQGLCNELPKKFQQLPDKKKIPNIPEPNEICKIIDNASDLFHKSLFLSLYHAGLRSQEARSLKWDDVSIDGGNMTVNGKGRRRIEMSKLTDALDTISKLETSTTSAQVECNGLLSGDLNLSCCTKDIEVLRCDGNREGEGLPDVITLRRGSLVVKYTECLRWFDR